MNYSQWKETMLAEDGEFVYLSDEIMKEQFNSYLNREQEVLNMESTRIEKLEIEMLILKDYIEALVKELKTYGIIIDKEKI